LRGFQPDYAKGLFAYWRQEPGFILNQSGYDKASILVAGQNFGCGSTREQAVWAIERYGFRVIIALGFAEVFRENLLKNGILPVILAPEAHARVVEIAQRLGSGGQMTVDLASQRITAPGVDPVAFDIAATERTALIEGLDEIGLSLKQEAALAAYEANSQAARPWQQGFAKDF
jgi:3-isopropylmalate/(R)-2-methylmalate dehydratase small subunit